MRQRHLAAVVAAAAGVILAAGPALPAFASKPAGPGSTHVINHHHATAVQHHDAGGTVVSVDATAGTITVSHTGDDADDTVTVASGATVTLDGKAATLADIPAGARVRLGHYEDGAAATVTAVTSWRVQLSGKVASVDATAGTLTLAGSATTLTVGSGATVKLDGKTATLADIPVGARVQIQATQTAAATTVTRLQARSPKDGKGKKD